MRRYEADDDFHPRRRPVGSWRPEDLPSFIKPSKLELRVYRMYAEGKKRIVIADLLGITPQRVHDIRENLRRWGMGWD